MRNAIKSFSGPSSKLHPLAALSARFLVFTLLGCSLFILIHLSLLNIYRGPSSGDDAWISLTAENLAYGKGYATLLSNIRSVPYDPNISTGPVLVITASAFIRFFGPQDWVPGTSQLALIVIQLLILFAILARRFAIESSALSISILIILLIFASSKNWYFGALLGEPVALVFLIIGFALLAEPTNIARAIAGGFSMSLAFLTKEISIFPILGAVVAYPFLNIRNGLNRKAIIAYTSLLISLTVMPLLFELIRLHSIGFDVYLDTWRKVATEATPGLRQDFSIRERTIRLIRALREDYPISFVAPIALITIFLRLNDIRVNRDTARYLLGYFFISLCACSILFFYLLEFSSLWSRYLWIGLGIILSVPAIMQLGLSVWWRAPAAILGVFCLCLILWGNTMRPMINLLQNHNISSERNSVATLIKRQPGIPLAAESWASIDDIVYVLGQEQRQWASGPTLNELRGQHFLAIINSNMTNLKSQFAMRVLNHCRPLTPNNRSIKLYACNPSVLSQ